MKMIGGQNEFTPQYEGEQSKWIEKIRENRTEGGKNRTEL